MTHNGSTMSMTPLRELPPDLQDRYGYRRTPRTAIALLLVAVLGLLAFGSWTALRLGNPPVTSKLLAWNAAAASHTDITYEVRQPVDVAVECVLRVQNQLHHDVGYAVVSVPSGTKYVQNTYSVATTEKGYAAELLGCSSTGLGNLAVADFPPGTSNPPQPWRPS